MSGNPDRANPEDSTENGADDTSLDADTPGGEEFEATPRTEIEAETARADENWDRYVRAAAELDNVRKRAARDVENARKFALERFATDLLAVKDSLEMGLEAAGTSGAADIESLLEGSRATLKQLTATLERFGVAEVDPAGEPFDPTLHEAMTTQPSARVEPNTVLEVFQKGYTLNGRLLRPARVVVAAEG